MKKSFNKDKNDNTPSLFSFNPPQTNNKRVLKRNLLNNNISYTKFELKAQNNYSPLDINHTNKMIQLNKFKNLLKKDEDKKLSSLISPKISKNDNILKIISPDKKRNKFKKEESLLIKTTLSFDGIRQILKKLVGNNVVENYDEKNLKFICKTKIGKDELIFYLELISMNYEKRIFKSTLIQGETKLYKELLLKIKEKLT